MAEAQHEKFMRKMGVSQEQLDGKLYDKYGKRKHVNHIPDYAENKPNVELSNKIASHGPAKESHTYSGERQLLGIATMHKSNMVPIFADKKEDAKDIASMRRQKMIRWYDYIVAFIAADFIFTNIRLLLTGNILMSMIGGLSIYFIINLWNTSYTNFRMNQETKNKK